MTAKSPTQPCLRATTMLVVVVLLFAVLWIPYRTLVLLSPLWPSPSWTRVPSSVSPVRVPTGAIHPIIYSLMSQKFQAAFWRLC